LIGLAPTECRVGGKASHTQQDDDEKPFPHFVSKSLIAKITIIL
jgi:hypothetical protein